MKDFKPEDYKESLLKQNLREWDAYQDLPCHDFPEGFEKTIFQKAQARQVESRKAHWKYRFLAVAAVLFFFLLGGALWRNYYPVYGAQISNPGLYYEMRLKVPQGFQLVRSRANDEIVLQYMDKDYHYLVFERNVRDKRALFPSGGKLYRNYEEVGIRWNDRFYDYSLYSNLDREVFKDLVEMNDFLGI